VAVDVHLAAELLAVGRETLGEDAVVAVLLATAVPHGDRPAGWIARDRHHLLAAFGEAVGLGLGARELAPVDARLGGEVVVSLVGDERRGERQKRRQQARRADDAIHGELSSRDLPESEAPARTGAAIRSPER
jgi:hypothetical protein